MWITLLIDKADSTVEDHEVQTVTLPRVGEYVEHKTHYYKVTAVTHGVGDPHLKTVSQLFPRVRARSIDIEAKGG